jgi:hypothetical protein
MSDHSGRLHEALPIAGSMGKSGKGGRGRKLLLTLVCILGMSASAVFAEEPKLTPEYIKQNYPDIYRNIQAAPKLLADIDPQNPYGDYGGFFSHPRFKPDQPEEWWERSAFEYSPEYPYPLKHTHMKFSGADMKGNDDGFVFKGSAYLALRKGKLSDYFAYEIDRKNVSDTQGGKTYKNTQTLEDTLLYEINPYLYVEGGLIWQRLSVQLINSRTIPFVGLGTFNLLQGVLDKKTDTLRAGIGFGRVFDRYDPLVRDLIKKNGDEFNAAYLNAIYTHKFTDKFSYKQNFVLKHAMEKTPVYRMTSIPQLPPDEQFAINVGSTYRYDWRWTNALELNINQYVGFLIQYLIAYDSNPWPIAAKRDKEFLAGFKFAF